MLSNQLKNGILNLDIVAGTSIGGINAAIIAGTKDMDDASKKLEEFWIELSERDLCHLSQQMDMTKKYPFV